MTKKINNKKILGILNQKNNPKSSVNTVYSYSKCTLDEIKNGTITSSDDLYDLYSSKLDEMSQTNTLLLTLPELMNAMINVGTDHHYWSTNYNLVTYSEETIGIDTYGKFTKKGEKVIVITHGGGLINQKKLASVQNKDSMQRSIKHTQEEFDMLLSGQSISGKEIKLYNYETIHDNKSYTSSNLPHKFGVVLPFKLILSTAQQCYNINEWMHNPLAISRCGAHYDNMEKFIQKVLPLYHTYGCFHRYKIDTTSIEPEGLLLQLTPHGIYSRGFFYNKDYHCSFISIQK